MAVAMGQSGMERAVMFTVYGDKEVFVAKNNAPSMECATNHVETLDSRDRTPSKSAETIFTMWCTFRFPRKLEIEFMPGNPLRTREAFTMSMSS